MYLRDTKVPWKLTFKGEGGGVERPLEGEGCLQLLMTRPGARVGVERIRNECAERVQRIYFLGCWIRLCKIMLLISLLVSTQIKLQGTLLDTELWSTIQYGNKS